MRIFENTIDPLTGIQTITGTEDGKLVIKTLQDKIGAQSSAYDQDAARRAAAPGLLHKPAE